MKKIIVLLPFSIVISVVITLVVCGVIIKILEAAQIPITSTLSLSLLILFFIVPFVWLNVMAYKSEKTPPQDSVRRG